MKIISGQAKGRPIKVKGNIRPTLSRVKQSIFDILSSKVEGARILDLYAGSGNMGIEALSRNAKEIIFVDRDYLQTKTIRENIKSLPQELQDKVIILKDDVFSAIKNLYRKQEQFDIIFLAPPFLKNYVKPTLISLIETKLLKENGLIIVEHHKKEVSPISIFLEDKELFIYKKRIFGDTVISIYKIKHKNESLHNSSWYVRRQ